MNLKDRVRTLYARRDELKNAVFMQDVADKRAADDARLAADLEAEIADLASKIRPAESPAVSQQGRTIAALEAEIARLETTEVEAERMREYRAQCDAGTRQAQAYLAQLGA